jgi:DNA-binding transcriptional ArsR family regulator
MAYQEALAALADPTRRAVFEQLKAGPRPVAEIARGLPVSRPAVSQHLKTLKEADLVRDEPRGTARLYRIHAPGLRELRDWVDGFWEEALASFKDYAEGKDERR